MADLAKAKHRQTMYPRLGIIVPMAAAAGTYYKGMLLAFTSTFRVTKASGANARFAGICQEDVTVAAGEPVDVLVNSMALSLIHI